MEASGRPFEAVNIGMTNTETGAERFTVDGYLRLPPVALWRVNLTALSQKYNLYFIASGRQIHVYEPGFPFQKLGGKPRLTITPQLANTDAQGYIQPREPHCINHVVVGDLGHQEILLVSTDSGNVVAYYTSSILSAIRKDVLRFSNDAQAEFVGLRPFFSQWVFESAWGLAIHSQGRMIAVSANVPYYVDSEDGTSKITVFAFALCATERDERTEGGLDELNIDGLNEVLEWTTWIPKSSSGDVCSDMPARDRNYKIVLAGLDGHINNIPCIAFINGAQDPDGSWLLSTDIHGEIKMWRIWRGRCLRTWNFADRGSLGAAWLRRYEAGWLVAALDLDSFRPAESDNTLVGYRRAPQYYGYDAAGPSYDLTNIVRQHVPSNSIYHPVNTNIDDGDNQTESDTIYGDMSDSEVTADEEETARVQKVIAELSSNTSVFARQAETRNHITTTSSLQSPTNLGIVHTRTSLALTDQVEEELLDEDSDVYVEESEDEQDVGVQIESDFSDDEISDLDGHGGSTDSPSTTVSVPSPKPHRDVESQDFTNVSSHEKQSILPDEKVNVNRTRKKRIQIPDVPFIHCSTSHLRMFSGTETRSPHIFCARMLKQILSPHMEGFPVAEMDRLNMIEQIPELGIVVIASQVGRCAVCTLTRRQSDGLPALRVDWVLPTREEERAGVRPVDDSLIGIATGPIQGRFVKESVPQPETDSEQDWAKDRVIDGIPTTFDSKIVDMGIQDHYLLDDSSEDESSREGMSSTKDHDKVRLPARHIFPVPIRTHHWPKGKANEDWMVIESSRRYRLMMTYADETVLTYELSRGVEKEDRYTPVQVQM